MGHETTAAIDLSRRHRRVAIVCASVVVAMAGMAYAAVPLYRLFCQVTGFGGTTQVAARPSETMSDRSIIVRFDANVSQGLPWEFKPVERTVEIKLGENKLVSYTAQNTSGLPVAGTASFNVSPEAAGIYFNKIECFCFTEQTLQPGEQVEMPVSFYVDPALGTDSNTQKITEITLSYTFFPVAAATQRTGQQVPGPEVPGRRSEGGKDTASVERKPEATDIGGG
ncbi:MAG: cytochrome c oxidase assembly protein [Hyphomicrobiaceae bacterium]|nr:cytochrome c oxidase assembly protein [Hyphomicrobiaceae bacterium]